MGDKAKRKKRSSTVFNDLKKQVEIEKPEEDEELVNYYKNKNFVAPVQRKFETIFEGSRRGFSEEGELNLGKGLDKRYIEEYQFWKQNDKDKNRKRKLKVQKQFKGRKNPKPKPLSAKDEKKLKKLIENVPEFETEPSSSSESDVGLLLEKAVGLLNSLSRSKFETTTPNLSANSSADLSHDHPSSSRKSEGENLEPGCSESSRNQEKESGFLEESRTISYPSDVVNSFRDENLDLELENISDENLKKEYLEALLSEDIMFCGPVKAAAGKKNKKERVSTRLSVRRSARFLRDASPSEAGSVFSLMDLPVKPAKTNRIPLRDESSNQTCDENTNVCEGTEFQVLNEINYLSQDNVSTQERAIKRRRNHERINSAEKENSERSKAKPEQKKRKRNPVSLMFEEDESGFLIKDSSDTINNTRWKLVTPQPCSSANPSPEKFNDRKSTDIALPDCVRRSLTGEFVPGRCSWIPEQEINIDLEPVLQHGNLSWGKLSTGSSEPCLSFSSLPEILSSHQIMNDSTLNLNRHILSPHLNQENSSLNMQRQISSLHQKLENSAPNISPQILSPHLSLDNSAPNLEPRILSPHHSLENSKLGLQIPSTPLEISAPNQEHGMSSNHLNSGKSASTLETYKSNLVLSKGAGEKFTKSSGKDLKKVGTRKKDHFGFSDSEEEEIISGTLFKKKRIKKGKDALNTAKIYAESLDEAA